MDPEFDHKLVPYQSWVTYALKMLKMVDSGLPFSIINTKEMADLPSNKDTISSFIFGSHVMSSQDHKVYITTIANPRARYMGANIDGGDSASLTIWRAIPSV